MGPGQSEHACCAHCDRTEYPSTGVFCRHGMHVLERCRALRSVVLRKAPSPAAAHVLFCLCVGGGRGVTACESGWCRCECVCHTVCTAACGFSGCREALLASMCCLTGEPALHASLPATNKTCKLVRCILLVRWLLCCAVPYGSVDATAAVAFAAAADIWCDVSLVWGSALLALAAVWCV